MNYVSETTILEDDDVIITDRRVVIGTETYALSDLISARLTKDSSTVGCLIAGLMSGGFLLALISFVSTAYNWEIRIGAFIFFGAALIVALLVSPHYIVQIRSVSGKANVLRSMDEDYLRKIVDAINGALVRRR